MFPLLYKHIVHELKQRNFLEKQNNEKNVYPYLSYNSDIGVL